MAFRRERLIALKRWVQQRGPSFSSWRIGNSPCQFGRQLSESHAVLCLDGWRQAWDSPRWPTSVDRKQPELRSKGWSRWPASRDKRTPFRVCS